MMFCVARMSWEMVRIIFFRISSNALFCSIVSSRRFLFLAFTTHNSGKHASTPHLGREIGITGEAEWNKAVFDCEVTIEDDV